MRYSGFKAVLLATAILGLAVPVHADDDAGTLSPEKADRVFAAKPNYSPYAGRNFPTRPLFGDTHLHTGMSFDAGAFGARLTRAMPIALRAARRSWHRAASRPSCRGRSTSWWWPTTPTTWACSPICSPASRNFSPIRRPRPGTT